MHEVVILSKGLTLDVVARVNELPGAVLDGSGGLVSWISLLKHILVVRRQATDKVSKIWIQVFECKLTCKTR